MTEFRAQVKTLATLTLGHDPLDDAENLLCAIEFDKGLGEEDRQREIGAALAAWERDLDVACGAQFDAGRALERAEDERRYLVARSTESERQLHRGLIARNTKIEALTAERDDARERLDAFMGQSTRLHGAGPDGRGGFQMTLSNEAIVPIIADALANVLGPEDGKAPNYVEFEVAHEKAGRIAITCQRLRGKTPHALRQEAERDLSAARAELARVRDSAARTWEELHAMTDRHRCCPQAGPGEFCPTNPYRGGA